MKEEWRDIEGIEGKYQVSNLGRVKSLDYGIMKPHKNQSGYLQVFPYENGVRKSYLVHRLVACAFIDNPDNLLQVNHKDQNKLNNCVSNLEWCNNQYNSRYSRARKVGCYKDGELIKVYDCIQDVKKDGFFSSAVILCCQEKRNNHLGYQWKYIE